MSTQGTWSATNSPISHAEGFQHIMPLVHLIRGEVQSALHMLLELLDDSKRILGHNLTSEMTTCSFVIWLSTNESFELSWDFFGLLKT